jgi:hypothetical protein
LGQYFKLSSGRATHASNEWGISVVYGCALRGRIHNLAINIGIIGMLM